MPLSQRRNRAIKTHGNDVLYLEKWSEFFNGCVTVFLKDSSFNELMICKKYEDHNNFKDDVTLTF
ncbi:hypothetical protein J6590_065689 [Homalodisca vitripennis]|nr:hypothetical protein J6590_065689 [Homalodisca vitripennis]